MLGNGPVGQSRERQSQGQTPMHAQFAMYYVQSLALEANCVKTQNSWTGIVLVNFPVVTNYVVSILFPIQVLTISVASGASPSERQVEGICLAKAWCCCVEQDNPLTAVRLAGQSA